MPDDEEPLMGSDDEQKTVAGSDELETEQLRKLVLDLVSERTGYPSDLLGLDQDMEADLGIDSIKRVEILGALQKALPDSWQPMLKTHLEQFTRVKTLNELLTSIRQAVEEPLPEENVEAEKSREEISTGNENEFPPAENIPGFRMVPEKKSLTGEPRTLHGTIVLTGDDSEICRMLISRLQEQEVKTMLIPTEMLKSAVSLDSYLSELDFTDENVAGIIHLAPLDPHEPVNCLGDWREMAQKQVNSLFHLLKTVWPDGSTKEPGDEKFVLSTSRLGGFHGRIPDDMTDSIKFSRLLGGGCAGLLKTWALETEKSQICLLDFAENDPAEQIAEWIYEEMLRNSQDIEVGYHDRERYVLNIEPVDLEENGLQPLQPDENWVVLATGGARGITAEVLRDFASKGCHLILVGRTILPGEEEEVTRGVDDPAELRKIFIDMKKRKAARFPRVKWKSR